MLSKIKQGESTEGRQKYLCKRKLAVLEQSVTPDHRFKQILKHHVKQKKKKERKEIWQKTSNQERKNTEFPAEFEQNNRGAARTVCVCI